MFPEKLFPWYLSGTEKRAKSVTTEKDVVVGNPKYIKRQDSSFSKKVLAIQLKQA